MLARLPAQPVWTGRMNAKDERPSPSTTSGRPKLREEELVAGIAPPGDPVLTGGIGQHGRGVDHEGWVEEGFAIRIHPAP